jgi:hypothetical protein
MNPLPSTPTLLKVARRVVWFKDPAATLADPVLFLAHVMTYGTVEDLAAVLDVTGLAPFRQALDNAPPGIFDPRSWAYWHLRFGRSPPPLMPRRDALFAAAPVTDTAT